MQTLHHRHAQRPAGARQRPCRAVARRVAHRPALQALPDLAAGLPAADPAAALTATYAALGAAGLSFLATFLVAPQFKDALKEPVAWQDMYAALSQKGVKTVTPQEALARARKG